MPIGTFRIKKVLSELKAERGKLEAIIMAEVALYLENFKITRASYHSGDYNGVCCRRLVDNSNNIFKNINHVDRIQRDLHMDSHRAHQYDT